MAEVALNVGTHWNNRQISSATCSTTRHITRSTNVGPMEYTWTTAHWHVCHNLDDTSTQRWHTAHHVTTTSLS